MLDAIPFILQGVVLIAGFVVGVAGGIMALLSPGLAGGQWEFFKIAAAGIAMTAVGAVMVGLSLPQ